LPSLMKKKYEEAKKAYEDGLAREADNEEIRKRLIEVNDILKKSPKRFDENGAPISPAQVAKEEGNLHFKDGRFEEALACYSLALENSTLPTEKSVLHSNRAACYAQNQNWPEGLKECIKALEYDPKNVKALLRRGLAYEGLERWQLALTDMKQVFATGAWSKVGFRGPCSVGQKPAS